MDEKSSAQSLPILYDIMTNPNINNIDEDNNKNE
jgi:hypothetical protein